MGPLLMYSTIIRKISTIHTTQTVIKISCWWPTDSNCFCDERPSTRLKGDRYVNAFSIPVLEQENIFFCSFLTLNHYTLFKVKYIFLFFLSHFYFIIKELEIVKKKVFCCNVKYKNGVVKEYILSTIATSRDFLADLGKHLE